MTSVVDDWVCPTCGADFPWSIPRSQRVRREWRRYDFRCGKCGQRCRSQNSFCSLWCWPATCLIMIVEMLLFGSIADQPWFHRLGANQWFLPFVACYGAIVGVTFGLTLGIGFRLGSHVVAVDEDGNLEYNDAGASTEQHDL